jgi:hypothetical protein
MVSFLCSSRRWGRELLLAADVEERTPIMCAVKGRAFDAVKQCLLHGAVLLGRSSMLTQVVKSADLATVELVASLPHLSGLKSEWAIIDAAVAADRADVLRLYESQKVPETVVKAMMVKAARGGCEQAMRQLLCWGVRPDPHKLAEAALSNQQADMFWAIVVDGLLGTHNITLKQHKKRFQAASAMSMGRRGLTRDRSLVDGFLSGIRTSFGRDYRNAVVMADAQWAKVVKVAAGFVGLGEDVATMVRGLRRVLQDCKLSVEYGERMAMLDFVSPPLVDNFGGHRQYRQWVNTHNGGHPPGIDGIDQGLIGFNGDLMGEGDGADGHDAAARVEIATRAAALTTVKTPLEVCVAFRHPAAVRHLLVHGTEGHPAELLLEPLRPTLEDVATSQPLPLVVLLPPCLRTSALAAVALQKWSVTSHHLHPLPFQAMVFTMLLWQNRQQKRWEGAATDAEPVTDGEQISLLAWLPTELVMIIFSLSRRDGFGQQ